MSQEQAQPDVMLVRIKPGSPRKTQIAHGFTIKAEDGWCKIPRAVAMLMKEEPLNDMNPESSPKVFDVMEMGEAAAAHEAETAKAEPAGTPDAPREKVAAPVEKELSTGKRK